jgi:subtilisin family serine protease
MKALLLITATLLFSLGFAQNSTNFVAGEIIVKIKSQYGDKCLKSAIEIPEIEQAIQKSAILQVKKTFPNHLPTRAKSNNPKLVDLSTMYTVQVDPLADVKKILSQFNNMESVAYAEEKVTNELTYTPNDTLLGSQWYIGAVDLFRAWDIQQGDTSVVVAFTDTGTDTDHPDMVANYSYNYNDPINGIDDDADGYIDNFLGWDVADDDNDVGFGNSGHGINVGGLVSAVTDNITGISGAGFKTRLMPVKIDRSSTGQLTAAYEGIVYAADHGATIITNSWGSTAYRQYAQDIINYAALNKGCLVIAATGNNGFENRFYPAAYDNVLSVGSLTSPDTVKTNSNFGYWTDIMAPGDNILTTNAIGGYGVNGGTSMAAPIVAGIAGLVKAQFPNYTWQQITEQIINNGDNIDSFNDPKYAGKLGAGRVNAFFALSDSSKPGIVFQDNSIYDNNDETFVVGDTLRVVGSFVNWLKDATNVSVTITTVGNKLQALNPSAISIGNLNSLDSFSVRSNPLEFKINQGVGFGEEIEFEVSIIANGYSKKQYFSRIINSDFLTIEENNLTVTATSDGGMGYTGSSREIGEGIRYKNGNSLLWDGSLLIGSQNNFIANKFRGENGNDADFITEEVIRPAIAKIADFETYSSSNFTSSTNDGLKVENKCYVFKHNQAENSIIYEYKITNTGTVNYTNLFAGLILDWDILNYDRNKIGYDRDRQMGVSYATDSALYCGVRVFARDSSLSTTHYAIDNSSNSGDINLSDGFSDAEKVQVLSTNKQIAGAASPQGSDIIDVNSVGPVSLTTGSHFYVSFLVTISDSLKGLQIESDTLKALYERIVLSAQDVEQVYLLNSLKVFPNPTSGNLNLELSLAKKENLQINIYNIQGGKVYSVEGSSFNRGKNRILLQNLDINTGIYFIEVEGKSLLFQQKIVVVR